MNWQVDRASNLVPNDRPETPLYVTGGGSEEIRENFANELRKHGVRNVLVMDPTQEQDGQPYCLWDLDWKRLGVFQSDELAMADLQGIPHVEDLFAMDILEKLEEEGIVRFVQSKDRAEFCKLIDGAEQESAKYVEEVMERSKNHPWDDPSNYALKYLVSHMFTAKKDLDALKLCMNINWIYTKAVARDASKSLIEQDLGTVASSVSKNTPAHQSVKMLMRVLKSGSKVFKYARQNLSDTHARQVFAEYIWNKLSGVSLTDRQLQMIVFNCSQLRKSLANHVDQSDVNVNSRWPVLANIHDPLIARFKTVQSSVIKTVVRLPRHRFACAGSSGMITVVNTLTHATQEFVGHKGWLITQLVFVKSLGVLISAALDATCKLWSLEEEEEPKLLGTFTGHSDSIRALKVATSAGKVYAVSGSDDGLVLVWDVETQTILHQFPESHSGWILDVAVLGTDDGKLLMASGSDDSTFRYWPNVLGISETSFQISDHHSNYVTSLTFLSDELLVTGSADRTVCLWTLASNDAPVLRITLEGSTKDVTSVLACSTKIIASSSDAHIRVWDIDSGKLLQTLSGHADAVNQIVFDGLETFFSCSDDSSVMLWDIGGIQQENTIAGIDMEGGEEETEDEHALAVTCVYSDSSNMFLGCLDGSVRVYDSFTDRFDEKLESHTGPVTAIRTNDMFVFSCSHDHQVIMWNRHTWQPDHILQGHTGPVYDLTLKDKFLVSVSRDRHVIVWDVSDGGKRLFCMRGHTGSITRVADNITPIEAVTLQNVALTCSEDSTIRGWDLSTGHEVRLLNGHQGPVLDVVVIDGKQEKEKQYCVSISKDKTVRVWDLVWGQQVFLWDQLSHANLTALLVDQAKQEIYVSADSGELVCWNTKADVVCHVKNMRFPISSMRFLTNEANSRTVIACSEQNEQGVVFVSFPKQEEDVKVISTHDLYGPFDHSSMCGHISCIHPIARNANDLTDQNSLCIVFQTSGFAILNVNI